MSGQPYSPEDENFLREYYPQRGCRWCAGLMHRSMRSVYNKAYQMGIVKPLRALSTEDVTAVLRELHPLGYSDREIADECTRRYRLQTDRHRIGYIRSKLGLGSNAASPRRRQLVSARTKQQLSEAGLNQLCDLRNEQFAKWKRDLGWPQELSIRAVQALELFYRHGSLTRAQLCDLMGIVPKKRYAPASNRGGSVLAELAAAGFITQLPKAIAVPFDTKLHLDKQCKPRISERTIRTKHISLYILNPGVKPNDTRTQPDPHDATARRATHSAAESNTVGRSPATA